MEMFVLLTGQTREREGWRCALEECGEPCVILGAMVMLVWCADSWDLKWTKEQVGQMFVFLCYNYEHNRTPNARNRLVLQA